MADPQNAEKGEDGARYYRWPLTNERFPSVTTILNIIAKPALTRWAAKGVAEYAVANVDTWQQLDEAAAVDLLKRAPYRYTEKRANLGTAIHEACEAYVKGETPEWTPDVEKHMETFMKFLHEWNPTVQATEISVYSRQHRYAGTFDLLVWLDNELVLLDIKTGKTGPYPEAGLQLAAYAHADFMDGGGIEIEMPKIDRAFVLVLHPRSYKMVPTRIDDEMFKGFLGASELWRWQSGLSKTVFGRALLPGDVGPPSLMLVKGGKSDATGSPESS